MTLDHLTMLAVPANEPFGEYIRDVIGSLSLRQARIRTGIDHDTLWRMKQGDVPRRLDALIAFARGFHRDVNEVLEIAGMEPIPPPSPKTPTERFLEGLKALARLYGPAYIRPQSENGALESLDLTEEEVTLLLPRYEASAIRQYRRERKPLPAERLFVPDDTDG